MSNSGYFLLVGVRDGYARVLHLNGQLAGYVQRTLSDVRPRAWYAFDAHGRRELGSPSGHKTRRLAIAALVKADAANQEEIPAR